MCIPCKENVICEGGNILNLAKGYWRDNENSDLILYCQKAPINCIGGISTGN